jgi:hypothetical protein
LGTDSNVRISLAEELRMLEYSQRLAHKARAVMADRRLDRAACCGTGRRGRRAGGGRGTGAIAVGQWADLLALDTETCGWKGCRATRCWTPSSSPGRDGLVTDLWSAGRHIVRRAATSPATRSKPASAPRCVPCGRAMTLGWEDIRAEVLRRIRARDWPPGALIPGEEALAAEFGVARATVNRALRAWPRPG